MHLLPLETNIPSQFQNPRINTANKTIEQFENAHIVAVIYLENRKVSKMCF